MTDRSDHYATLGMKRGASPNEIKRAYRKLAKQFHPDRNPDNAAAEQKFKEVQHAYDVLGDKEKRAKYDQFGDAAVGNWATDPRGQRVYQWGTNSKVNAEDLEDLFSAFGGGGGGGQTSIFDDLFGGLGGRRERRPTPQRGADEQRRITLTFEQAARGAVVTVQLTSRRNGRSETIDVKIPPGVEEGQRIRLAGKGHAGTAGGAAGDFYLICSIKPHPFFRRSGADLYLDVPVSLTEAAMGARIEVPTLDGRVTVTLPPGTAGGSKLRLKGRGIVRSSGGGRGDLYVVVQVAVPTQLSGEQRRLLEELRRCESSDPRADCPWTKDQVT